jgi:methylthioribose-1-phosphate isomerase
VITTGLAPVRLAADGQSVRIIDQRRLPEELVYRDLASADEVIDAIRTLAVRGAPAIGIAGAAGLAVAIRTFAHAHPDAVGAQVMETLSSIGARIAGARPTAVNLGWAVDRCLAAARGAAESASTIAAAVAAEARRILDEDLEMGAAIATHALAILPDHFCILTHCNTGSLATGGAGTALAPVYAAHAVGRSVTVFATETRPLLQGSRLTAWELHNAGIPVTVIPDGAAASLLRSGRVDAVLVGADRIAANGDVANKVGTYAIAIAARRHGVPFHVLAPRSTIDASTARGHMIEIELRARDELAQLGGRTLLADGIGVWNPAFDVTPASLVSAIITDGGVHRPPYDFGGSPR